MAHTSFEDRVSHLNQKHRRLSLGVSYRVGKDGLIVTVPPPRIGPRFPLRAVLFVLIMGFAFKAILFTGLGEATYAGRLSLLEEGNMAERAAAWAMQPDPAVRLIADLVRQANLP